MKKNPVLKKFRAGDLVTCLWMNIGDASMAEAAAQWGYFDSILLDYQHGYWSEASMMGALQSMMATGTAPLIRVASNDPARIGRALDLGALGVIVPMVNSAEESEAAVRSVRYPPEGDRSAGGTRLLYFGEDYFNEANSEIALIVMLETKEAVERADEILSVPGVDAGFIGPGDLAISFGCYPERGPVHEEAMLKILDAGTRAGKPMGLLCPSVEEALKRIEQGFRFIPYQVDYLAFKNSLDAAHAEFSERVKGLGRG